MDAITSARIKALSERLEELENALGTEAMVPLRKDAIPGIGFSINIENPQVELAFANGDIPAASGLVLGFGYMSDGVTDSTYTVNNALNQLPVWNPWATTVSDGTLIQVVKDKTQDQWIVLQVYQTQMLDVITNWECIDGVVLITRKRIVGQFVVSDL